MGNQIEDASSAQIETSHEDVVQMILKDRKKEANESSEMPGTSAITPEAFYLDNNPRGAMKKETLKHLLNVLPESKLQDMQLLFQRMSEGAVIDFKAVAYGK